MNPEQHPSDAARREALVDTLIHWVIIVVLFVVAAIAFVVSYSHMQELAYEHGERWRSYLIPISADGLIIIGSMVLINRRRKRQPTSVMAWVALVLGVLASLAANARGANPNPTAIIIAAWAPIAFGIGFDLMLQQLRDRKARASTPAGTATPAPATPARSPEPPGPAVPERTTQEPTVRHAFTVAAPLTGQANPSRSTFPVSDRNGPVDLPGPDHSGDPDRSTPSRSIPLAPVRPLRPAAERIERTDPADLPTPVVPGSDRSATHPDPASPQRGTGRDGTSTPDRSDPTGRTVPPSRDDTGPDRSGTTRSDADLLTEIRQIAERTGKAPTMYSIKQLNVGSSRAKRLLADYQAGEAAPAAAI